MSTPDLTHWIPATISVNAGEPLVSWTYFGKRRFLESFFDHTLEKVMREPFSLLFQQKNPLSSLLERQASAPGIKPTGFVYHMSRCGSTLVSQMLSKVDRFISLSEPPPLNSLLRLDRLGVSEEDRIAYLRAWAAAASQPRNDEDKFFIKLDAWHVFDLALLRRAFPETPWIFLHRNPVEVMASALKIAGSHLVPGLIDANAPGIDTSLHPHEYMARVLGAVCEAALLHADDPLGIYVDYTELPEAVTGRIARHFGLQLSSDELERMNAATTLHAKNPQFTFEPDSEAKRAELNDYHRELCARFIDPAQAKLRALSVPQH